MSNFIFSIKEIFSTCLSEHDVEGYYIGPYQRGYKWKSRTLHDQIPVLLTDLFEAFLKKKNNKSSSEYFLQYITVKRTKINSDFYFEVIDGQQRLTSLTLLFNILEKFFEQLNIAKNQEEYILHYSRYEDDKVNIFDTILNLFDSQISIDTIKEQDKYYMYLASNCFKIFFEILNKEEEDFKKFIDFISEDVKIILNKEDEFTSAEEVFSSLNANKVPLTNAYLIKGLLLTKAARTLSNSQQKKHFKEIMDERSIMGRTWDEMNNWFSQPQVGIYFFDDAKNGLEKMLELIELDINNETSELIKAFRDKLEKNEKKFENDYQLFNKFHENTQTAEDAIHYLLKIKHIYKRFKSWYDDNNTYNLIGYYLQTGGKIKSIYQLDNIKLHEVLCSNVLNRISCKVKENGSYVEKKIEALSYNKNQKIIKQLLLALSVFPEGIDKAKEANYRFDFYNYIIQNWSLEHIFPQNPNSDDLDISDDKDWIIKELLANGNNEVVRKIENGEKVSSYDLASLFEDFDDVHRMGNMALLSGKVNSALSNGFFNTKRKILFRKINSGSFVPKHTIDVFSKMLEAKKKYDNTEVESSVVPFDPILINWSNKDAMAHSNWISNRIISLRKEFSK